MEYIKVIIKYKRWFIMCCAASTVLFVCFLVVAVNRPADVDIRIMNLIVNFRAPEDANIFLFITYLGNAEIIASLGLIIMCALWLLRRKQYAIFVFSGVVAAYVFADITKLLIHRNRPSVFYSLIKESGFSFPSGHATISVVFYGIIVYFLCRAVQHRWQKIIIILLFLSLIVSIGFSRMYLGVHWFSDIFGGWLLGFSILIFLIALLKLIQIPTDHEFNNISVSHKNKTALLLIIMFLLEGLFIVNYYRAHPLQPPINFSSQKTVFISNILELQKIIASDDFPKFSETITGKKMEPVSLIVVGSLENITQVFRRANWYISDRRIGTVFRLAITALLNKPDPNAFITPAFLKTVTEIIAFEKPTALNTVRQRHHTRFWTTNFVFQGSPIWVATASFDEGLRYFITHKIRPDIDTERDYIKDDLIKTNFVANIQEIKLVEPMSGKNQVGDEFFTAGKAYIIFLK